MIPTLIFMAGVIALCIFALLNDEFSIFWFPRTSKKDLEKFKSTPPPDIE